MIKTIISSSRNYFFFKRGIYLDSFILVVDVVESKKEKKKTFDEN